MAGYPYYNQGFINPYPMGGFYQQSYQQGPIMQQQGQQMQNAQVQPIQPQQNAAMQPAMQIQNGGFVTVRSEADARNYPVAPGMSVTFKHETAPYCYTKTMGFNQFEAPRFEKFRLVKEEDEAQQTSEDSGKETAQATAYAKEEDLGNLAGVVKTLNDITAGIKADVENLKADMYGISGRKRVVKKQEAVEDE